MTDFAPPTEPDWTRLCKGSDLKELRGEPYVLRETEDPDSPRRSVATRHEGNVQGSGDPYPVLLHDN
jgi:hypothetical protein